MTVREVAVTVDGFAVWSITTGEALVVMVVVRGPSGPSRFRRARFSAIAGLLRTVGGYRRASVPAATPDALATLSILTGVEVHLAALVTVFVEVVEMVVAEIVRWMIVFVVEIVMVLFGQSKTKHEGAFGLRVDRQSPQCCGWRCDNYRG
jgi:hypothetical protein